MPKQPLEKLALKPRHLALLQQILAEHAPQCEIWAYGSRVNGNGHEGSDLDLVIFNGQETALNLRYALQESLLPMLIDLHQWEQLPTSFQENIKRNFVVIQA